MNHDILAAFCTQNDATEEPSYHTLGSHCITRAGGGLKGPGALFKEGV